jgi:hypothetical protein
MLAFRSCSISLYICGWTSNNVMEGEVTAILPEPPPGGAAVRGNIAFGDTDIRFSCNGAHLCMLAARRGHGRVTSIASRHSGHPTAHTICRMRIQSESSRNIPTSRSCRLCDPVSGRCRSACASGPAVQSPNRRPWRPTRLRAFHRHAPGRHFKCRPLKGRPPKGSEWV